MCRGYRGAKFVDGGAQLQTRLRGQALAGPKQKPEALSWQKPQQHQAPDEVASNIAVPAQASPRPCMLALHHQQTYLPHGVAPVAGDEQTTSSYLAASLGQLGTLYEKIVTPGFEGSSAQWTVTRHCFLALATTVYGIGHSHEHIANSGRRLYCQSLSLLNNTMQRSYKSQNGITPVIGAVVALALHEVRQPPFCYQASRNMVADISCRLLPRQTPTATHGCSISRVLRSSWPFTALFQRRAILLSKS